MKIHEHQAKELFAQFNVPTTRGKVAFSVKEAVAAAQDMKADGISKYVVKAQIHAGGRGKGGGVKLADDTEQVKKLSQEILGMQLVTHQTGPEGKKVQRLWIEEATPPIKEMYLSMILDRERECVTVLSSEEGGMEIEELAANEPEKILTLPVNFLLGWQRFYTRRVSSFLGLNEKLLQNDLHQLMSGLYDMFVAKDCSLVEVNPLAICEVSGEQRLLALDGKINFDDNALPRHPEIAKLRDLSEEDPLEVEASTFDLNYIALDGEIGCMVNGAGLAMATMDIIKTYGSEPANFLDVGGSATTEKVTAAFKIILKDEKVKAIFVNIFGGIMKCDVIAEGVIAAAKEVKIEIPLVVRLEGTNVEKGRELLESSGLAIIPASSMSDGAQKVVNSVKGAQ